MAPMLLLLQAAAGPPTVIDLTAPVALLLCPEGDGGDVVVCGRRSADAYRIGPREPDDRRTLPKAEMRLFGEARGAIEAEAATIPPGMQSNRLMFRLKLPF